MSSILPVNFCVLHSIKTKITQSKILMNYIINNINSHRDHMNNLNNENNYLTISQSTILINMKMAPKFNTHIYMY